MVGKDTIDIETLKDAVSFYENILSKLPTNVYWKDENSVYMGCNDRFASIMGLPSRHAVEGMTDFDFGWSEKEAKSFIAFDKKVMQTGLALSTEDVFKDATSKTVTVLTTKTPLTDKEGKSIGVLAISVDITERKKAEMRVKKAEAATLIFRAKAEAEEEMRKTVMVLVGDIVHDLRTPIATIRTVGGILGATLPGILEVVEEARDLGSKKVDLLNKKKLEAIVDNTLISALQSSVVMIDDFINTTLSELGNAQKAQQVGLTYADLVKCSSRRILENTLDAYPFPDNIQVHQNISYDFFLMGNSILVMKILFNLIKNAVEQIILNGKGDITITTEMAGDKNLLKIKDTGGGAPPEVIANFFKGYFTTKKNGTGVGLAYSKKTMKYFDGDLTCHSVYGEYMEFALSFPKIDNK